MPDESTWSRPLQVGSKYSRHKREPTLGFLFSIELSSDPFGVLPFLIPIDGYFTELSGLAMEYDVIDFQTTDPLGYPNRNLYPGRPIYSPITLRRGVTGSKGFWLWHQMLYGMKSPVMTAYLSLTVYDRSYEPIAVFTVSKAWPSKISGIEVRSDSNDILMEEMVLQHGGIKRDLFVPL